MPVSRPAVSQHLAVLKKAGLVGDRAEGTRRVYYIDPTDSRPSEFGSIDSGKTRYRHFKRSWRKGVGQMISIAPVRKQITVNANQQRAFDMFTNGCRDGGLRLIPFSSLPSNSNVVEPRAGGRWYASGRMVQPAKRATRE